ncbi:NAD(P)/FAD-dependent oxidoreductase [Methylobacterium iners]|uniref:Rhodocoxin reductase n=1 Tax=Methylobacterium iners TaxID=418707 RepID=A0ABQ4RZP5_9HYPH|nr:FAD-dependent oxidoreductase [Methylobacterium iners]GJD96309.1 Rhodocoxin reductase [Methylobacterium iners]
MSVVIVGAGQAGLQVAASLREAGYAGSVTLVGEEADLPYQRPPLSKAYLAGKTDAAGLALRAPGFFSEHRIEHRAGIRATAVDRARREVHVEGASPLPYEHLVLATGARVRPLPVPGADLEGVHALRSLADADRLKAALADAREIAIVGAGFIGLELAAICSARGLSVTVIEAAGRPMARAVSVDTGAFFRDAQAAAGVRFRFGAGVTAVEGEGGRAVALALADGDRLAADLVLVGIGVIPNEEIAGEAGLAVGNGIHVDAFLATQDPVVSAIGDCARFPSRFADGAAIRIESVQNALDQGRCVAARIAGRPAAYDAVPWFWSDQGPHKLQIAGLPAPGDESVVRHAETGFSVFRFRDGRLTGVESVDRAADHMAARRILAQAIALTPDQAADTACDLKAVAMGRG